MYDKDMPFQLVFFFAYGLLFGGLSNLYLSIAFIIVYEFFIFHISRFYPPKVKEVDRFLLNLVYIFGWIFGRCMMLNETGFEDLFEKYLRFE